MSYYEGPPWGTIAAKKKLKETEDQFTDWRTRLVKIGERVLREIEKGNVSEETKKKLRHFIEETKAAGIQPDDWLGGLSQGKILLVDLEERLNIEGKKVMPGPHPEDLILLLESIYSRLREQNPDRDEHWLLANTWSARYGSSKQAKKQGAAWVKFVAYKDTLQFSILETPKSIKALALFLVYKELGENAAASYATEYAQLYERIDKCISNHAFIDEYKKKNPRTWSENLVEDDSPYSLYWLFRGWEFKDNQPEQAEEVLRQMELRDQ